MKKILVPCDFSQPSIEALKFAVEIARQSKGELLLLHAIELPVLYDSSVVLAFEQDYMKDQRAAVEKKLAKLKEKWAKDLLKTKIAVEFGGTLTMIEQTIENSGVDLVVLGTHGASGLKEYTIGSNTEKVVRNSKVPVIAVKNSVKDIKNIVFPISPNGDQEEITMLVKQLQDFFKAPLHILYVNTPAMFRRDSQIMPLLESFAKRYMLKNYVLNIYNDITEDEGIINFTKKLNAPLVAMRTHGRKGITHLAVGSIAEDVVNHIECPIWTYRIK